MKYWSFKRFVAIWLTILTVAILMPLPKKLYVLLNVEQWSIGDYIIAIQTFIIGISAIVAVFTIVSARSVSREKATLEIILADNKDRDLIESHSDLLLFLKSPKKFYKEYNDKNDLPQSEDVDIIDLPAILKKDKDALTPAQENIMRKMLTVLSRHEFYAIGINNGLLDERLFKRMSCSNFIQLWEQVSPAVNQMRTQNNKDTLFKDFELLATRWKANPLRVEDIIKASK